MVTCRYLLNEGYAASSGVNSRLISIRAGRGCRAKTVLAGLLLEPQALPLPLWLPRARLDWAREPPKMALKVARMHAVRRHEFVEQAIELLREQLGVANQRGDDEMARADRAEQRADDERNRADRERDRADRVEQQLTAVEVQLVTARAEVAGVRCQLEQARPKPPRTRWGRLLRALGHTR